MIRIERIEDGFTINGHLVTDEQFSENEMFSFETKGEMIENHTRWITECGFDAKRASSKEQMLNALEKIFKLQEKDDEYLIESFESERDYISQSEDLYIFTRICTLLLQEQGELTDEEIEELIYDDSEYSMTDFQYETLGLIVSSSPNKKSDWFFFINGDPRNDKRFQICEEYEDYPSQNLKEKAKEILNSLEEAANATTKKQESKSYLLQERDLWYSTNSAVNLGIFSSIKNAMNAATKEYGKLEQDGTSLFHYEPVNNPNDVKIYIIEFETDVFEEK